jgi:small neutral amino acid transporter SnatA (MarC family)
MQNRSAILSSLVVGVLLIAFALFLTWQYGDIKVFTITSVACIIAGGICIVLSGIGYLKSGDKEDYFHVE